MRQGFRNDQSKALTQCPDRLDANRHALELETTCDCLRGGGIVVHLELEPRVAHCARTRPSHDPSITQAKVSNVRPGSTPPLIRNPETVEMAAMIRPSFWSDRRALRVHTKPPSTESRLPTK